MKKPNFVKEFQELDAFEQISTIVVLLFIYSLIGMLLTGGGDRHNYMPTIDEDQIVY